jgi:branched-chain amino acid transport system permease protein
MTALAQHLVDGLSVGSTYALLALGLTLAFSVMNLINFAYGMILVLAGYGMAEASAHGVAALPTMFVGIATAMVVSVLTGYVAFRPFLQAPLVTLLITSFGVELALQAIAIIWFGDAPLVVTTPGALGHVWHLGGVRLPATEVASIGLGAAVVVALYVVLHHTSLGLQLRATAEERSVARLLAVRPERVVVYAFLISGLIVGVVSVLWFARLGAVTPTSDLDPTIDAFIAIVLGGLGSISGAVAGGLVLGGLYTVFNIFLPGGAQPYEDVFVFALVIAVLMFRPHGLLGRPSTALR